MRIVRFFLLLCALLGPYNIAMAQGLSNDSLKSVKYSLFINGVGIIILAIGLIVVAIKLKKMHHKIQELEQKIESN